MKKLILFSFMLLAISKASIGQYADFQNLLFPSGKNFWKGSVGVAGDLSFNTLNLNSDTVTFINRNDTSSFGDYWSGWAYSKIKDTVSIVYDTSDCAAFYNYDTTVNIYATAYQSWNDYYNRIRLHNHNNKFDFLGMEITNSTIAYRSMQNGDFVAKKFGGATGNDPDYFKIRFFGWRQGNPITDTFDFYLADFRDTNNANDYIVKDWTYADFPQSYYLADSISYLLESSDNGAFGMNTPAYFCVDRIHLNYLRSVSELTQSLAIKIFPNPINNEFQISNSSTDIMKYSIINLNGQLMYQSSLKGNATEKINSENWHKGIYIMKIEQNNQIYYQKLTK